MFGKTYLIKLFVISFFCLDLLFNLYCLSYFEVSTKTIYYYDLTWPQTDFRQQQLGTALSEKVSYFMVIFVLSEWQGVVVAELVITQNPKNMAERFVVCKN